MSNLVFEITGSRSEAFAVSPLLSLQTRITETTGAQIHSIALRAQINLEPQLRRYGPNEQPRLEELFGLPSRYGATLRPMLWTHVSHMVLAFRETTSIDLQIPCSYDFEVAAHKYLSALEDGEIPLVVMFSGMIYLEGPSGASAELVPWTCEAHYRMPVQVWRDTMDAFFPNSAWIRLRRDAFDELYRYRTAHGLHTWEATIERLCDASAAKPDGER